MIKSFVAVVATVALCGLMTAPAAAAFNPENELHVYGRVLPAHHVIINEQGDISQVISNTTEDVTPRVYLNQISKETEVPLNDVVLQKYRQIIPTGSSKVGVLYKKDSVSEVKTLVRSTGVSLTKMLLPVNS